MEDQKTVTTDQQSQQHLHPGTVTDKSSRVSGSADGDSTVDITIPIKNEASVNDEDEENKYSSDEEEDEDPDSTEIIHIDSFSFFFQRDSPAKLSDDHLSLQSMDSSAIIEDMNIGILLQQKFELVVHNECIMNYGPYADDLRAKLMSNFLPFMYQHREPTPLIPEIGEYFNCAKLDATIKFDEPKFPMNTTSYSDTAPSIKSEETVTSSFFKFFHCRHRSKCRSIKNFVN